MTVTSSAIAGLFAARDGVFRILPWLFMTLGLMFGHASNNLFNDYTDFVRGVDKDNYFRTMYGPQPVAHGLMTTRQLLGYFGVTGAMVIACVLLVFALDDGDPIILLLFAIGAAFVLLYTWPLKYVGLGEISVLAVWGPLMIGGGYYVLTRHWSWEVIWGSAPYVLGVTTVILGKHIDKSGMDGEKGIRTLPGADRREGGPRPSGRLPRCPVSSHRFSRHHALFHAGACGRSARPARLWSGSCRHSSHRDLPRGLRAFPTAKAAGRCTSLRRPFCTPGLSERGFFSVSRPRWRCAC